MVVSHFAKALTVATTFDAASCAVDNNFVPHAAVAIAAGASAAYALYEIYDTYETQGPKAALKQAGYEAGAAYVGGVFYKKAFTIAGKSYLSAEAAWVAYVATSPTLSRIALKASKFTNKVKSCAADVSNKLTSIKESVADSSLGRAMGKMNEFGMDLSAKLNKKTTKFFGLTPKAEAIHAKHLFSVEALDLASRKTAGTKFNTGLFAENIGMKIKRARNGGNNNDTFSVHAFETANGRIPAATAQAPAQVRINYQKGRKFQNEVHEFLRIPENHKIYTVNLSGKKSVGTKPDLPLHSAGVTDIKDVRYITFTPQLRAQMALAREQGTCFNLIISPWTEKISKKLEKAVIDSGGRIFEYNPSLNKMFQRSLEGNKVVRK